MTFKEDIASDLNVFFNDDEFAYSAIYTDTELNETECSVFLDHDVILQPDSYEAQVVESGSTITAKYSDVGEPKAGSTFLIGSTTYTVHRITENNRELVTMVVTG